MQKAKTTVYRFMLSDHSFNLVVEAIAILSRKRRKFVGLRDVVATALEVEAEYSTSELAPFLEISAFEGPNQVFLRADTALSKELEALKDDLNSKFGLGFGIREIVCFCAFKIVKMGN